MPVRELAAVAAEFGIPMHADAVQAFGQLEVDFAASGLAAMTVSGHKIGGPYGIGALLLGRDHSPVPVLHGGGQERHVRSGTLDVPAIASFAVAGRLAAEGREHFARRVGGLRDDLVAAVRARRPGRRPRRRPGPGRAAPRQRALQLPRLRGRLPPAPPGRPGHRVLHRLRLHRRDRPAQPRTAGHRHRPGPGPRHPALLARPHLDRGGREGAGRRRSARRWSGRGRPD